MPSSDTLDNIVVKPKPFKCHRCQRRFGRLEHLQRHERTHTQERPFACVQCDSRFTRSDLLIRHERLSHQKEKGGAQKTQTNDDNGDDHSDIRKPAVTVEERAAKRQRKGDEVHVATRESGLDRFLKIPRAGPDLEGLANFVVANECRDDRSLQRQGEPGYEFLTHSTFPQGLHVARRAEEESAQDWHSPSGLVAEEGTERESIPLEPPDPHPSTLALTSSPLTITLTNSNNDLPDPDLDSPFINLDAIPAISQALSQVNSTFDLTDFTALLETASESADAPFYRFDSLISTEMAHPDQIGTPCAVVVSPGEALDNSNQSPLLPRQQHENRDMPAPAFSEFGARLSSADAEEHQSTTAPNHHAQFNQLPEKKPLPHLSPDDRAEMETKMTEFASATQHFQLPSRLALSRYFSGYIDMFHQHLPFLHFPTMTVQGSPIELLLAIAAVGAQYCYEADKGVELFIAARAIASERIERRAMMATSPAPGTDDDMNLIPTAQALLLLMAMATWSYHQQIIGQATMLQSTIGGLLRKDGLSQRRGESPETYETWQSWSRAESTLRTKYIAYCFFNLQTIVYGIPPLIATFEISMQLPCSDAEFEATTEDEWHRVRPTATRSTTTSNFQAAFRNLFLPPQPYVPGSATHSSLANYILIHALIQNIFWGRQASCGFQAGSPVPFSENIPILERALAKWQYDFERSPECPLDPADHNHALSLNSRALLRLAKIRLNVYFGPRSLALSTRDPAQVAQAMRDIPRPLQRSPELLSALEHAAHGFSIPVRIGLSRIVRTQPFIWSIQHSLCSLECALLLSKWLEILSTVFIADWNLPLADKEWQILYGLSVMLAETPFELPDRGMNLHDMAKCVNIGVLRVWASIFRVGQTWAVVETIGAALDLYADMMLDESSDQADATAMPARLNLGRYPSLSRR